MKLGATLLGPLIRRSPFTSLDTGGRDFSMKLLRRSLILVLVSRLTLLFALSWTAHAQLERASLVGNNTDKTGAAMAGVEVTITSAATNSSQRLVTDDSGAYSAVNLIPGV